MISLRESLARLVTRDLPPFTLPFIGTDTEILLDTHLKL
jgi:hypothetical protein